METDYATGKYLPAKQCVKCDDMAYKGPKERIVR